MTMHADQLDVTPEVVRQLVDEQFPQWRALPISTVTSHGTANAIFRIGERLVARFPLKPNTVESTRRQLDTETDAATELLGRTRFRTPEPVASGQPGAGYPLPWSVQTWLPGVVADERNAGDSVPFARDLAEFIRGVRAIELRGRVVDLRDRGGDLRSHDAWLDTCFDHSEHLLDVPRLRRLWRDMRELPRSPGGDVMAHGDLIPGNLLTVEGRLAGVLDVGALGPSDPAVDLVIAWHLLAPEPRRVLRAELGCDELEWERGKAWAFEQAMGLVWYYVESMPSMSRMGRRTLERIMADTPPE